ncbi:MAG: glycosyl transferase family protein [Erythrobacter sp.]
MSIWPIDPWQWLVLCQHELLLFAGVFFLIGALDDLCVDAIYLWLRARGRIVTVRRDRALLAERQLAGPAAVFIPAWSEAEVIGDTLDRLLGAWQQRDLRVYVGCYRNDPATIAVVMAAAQSDDRVRLVIHAREGPTTKADCLNRLYIALCADEQRLGGEFTTVVFQDAEDMVDAAALGLIDETIAAGADFVQLPVEPLVQRYRSWLSNQLGSHYCEEFAEAHGQAMVVRDALGAAVPGAGVGCAAARAILHRLVARRPDGLPFCAESLTEDYELGLAVREVGGTCRFVRARGEDGSLIATRAYFPARLDHVVSQKTRWIHGIALQGWDRVGWGGGLIERWMRARDRRGPFAGLVLLTGYVVILITALGGVAMLVSVQEPEPLPPLLKALLVANLVAFLWRVAMRFAFTARIYGWAEGARAVLRIPLANVVAIMAGRRAVMAYIASLRGSAVVWDKTPHVRHPAHAAGTAPPRQPAIVALVPR